MIDFSNKLNNKILLWQSENHGYFWHDLYVFSVYKNDLIKSIMGFQENNIFAYNYNDEYYFFLDKTEVKNNELKFKKFCLSNQYVQFTNDIRQLILEKDNYDLELITKNNWQDNFITLCHQYSKSASYYCCTESYYTDALYKTLLAKYPKKLIDNLIRPLSMPSVIASQLDWYWLCLQPFSESNMLEYYNKWKNIICSHKSDPYTIQQLKERYFVEILNIAKIRENYELLKKAYSEDTIKQIKKQIEKLPKQDAKLIYILAEITYLRFELRHVWMTLGYLINIMLKDRFGKKYTRITEFSYEEIVTNAVDFDQHRANFLYEKVNGVDTLFYNGLEIDAFKEILQKGESTLYGTASFGENVSGEAVVVTSAHSLQTQTELTNKILVIPQITPDYIPYVGLCKGIVTNEGGITGHASIIVREMKKPSILGVHNATQHIKTGNQIKLDMKEKHVMVINL